MPANTSTRFKTLRKRLLVGIAIVGCGVGAFALNLVRVSNFHTVSTGQVYRSGQMSSETLAKTIEEHGIKSVLNLRGGAGEVWHSAETNTANQFGAKYFDFPLSATRELTDAEMDSILDTLATAPKPVLIHCKSGSDRTGLIGALYLYRFEGLPAKSASGQLTALYGHLPLFWSGTIAMDRSYWRYVSNHAQMPATNRAVVPAKSGPEEAALATGAQTSGGVNR